MANPIEKYFGLKEHGTNVRIEFIAGLTTFLTMAYIIFVNPAILSNTGMDKGAVFVATIIAAAIGTLIMGLFANVPFAQAPGMGMNAFFTFTVVLVMGYPWQQALGFVLISGCINIIVTATRLRKTLILAIPESLQYAISGGIGLFIAYIGVKNAHFLNFTVENVTNGMAKDVIPSLVNFSDPVSLLAIIGLALMLILLILKVQGAILWGILLTTIIGIFMKVTAIPSISAKDFVPPSILPTFFKLDIVGLFNTPAKAMTSLTVVLAFCLADMFDCIGTFLGTGRKTGIFDQKDENSLRTGKGFSSKLDKALFSDAIATSIGGFLGTSSVTTYIESASGIAVGGKTGLTSFFIGIFFLASLFLAPFALMIPGAATAPALIVVGILMMGSVSKVHWDNFDESASAFFTVVVMPFTYSIANGLAAGFIFYVLTKIVKGKWKEVHPLMYIVTALFLLNFIIAAFKK